MKRALIAALATGALGATPMASATDFDVTITNLTHSMYFTPFLIAAHPDGSNLFVAGQPASAHLQAMAEGGDISGLETDVNSIGATVVTNPVGGLLAPASSISFSMNTDGTTNNRLSILAMLLPSNDAFAGLNAVAIPTEPGRHIFDVPAYDAGTEANDEIINGGGAPGVPGIPADPSGFGGTGGTGAAVEDANPNVHIHRGSLGDTDPTGGTSDIDRTVHRWLNPVIRVTVVVY